MRKISVIILPLALAAFAFAAAPDMAAAENMSHAHMGHVTDAWGDTPDGKGLLPTAMAEAEIAIQHAGFAANKPDDLEWMQTHTRHVLHAVDPSVEANGPGLGYGVVTGAGGAAAHINYASQSDDASDNVRAHAVHVATSSQNTVARAEEIVAHGKKVLSAGSAADAHHHVTKIVLLADQLLAGIDADGDGTISWSEGEGGLNEAMAHMGYMAKGEGMN